MIGLMESGMEAYCIMQKLQKEFSCPIYLCKEEEESIQKLIQKGCCMIIVPNTYQKEIKKQKNIHFFSLPTKRKKNVFVLNQPELIKATEAGNEQEIRKILQSITIPKQQTIYLENPKLLWIEHIIKEIFPNPIEDSVEEMIQKMKKIEIPLQHKKEIIIIK